MLGLALRLILFSVFVSALVIGIATIRIPDEYICEKTENTSYRKIAWNLRLINSQGEKIKGSFVFLGPSLIQAGVCDSTLNACGIKSLNLGTNGGGNEIELYFLKKILPLKPRKIYLHLFKDTRKELHAMTPLLYTPKELLSAGQAVNLTFIKYLFKRAGFVISYLIHNGPHQSLNSNIEPYGKIYDDDPYTFAKYSAISKSETDDYFHSFSIMKSGFRKRNEAGRKGVFFDLIRLRRNFLYWSNRLDFIHNTHTQAVFEQNCFSLCQSRGVDCEFIYMPVVADAKSGINFCEEFYTNSYGKKIISLNSFNFLDSCAYWADMTHLSREGAIAFSKALIEQKVLE